MKMVVCERMSSLMTKTIVYRPQWQEDVIEYKNKKKWEDLAWSFVSFLHSYQYPILIQSKIGILYIE